MFNSFSNNRSLVRSYEGIAHFVSCDYIVTGTEMDGINIFRADDSIISGAAGQAKLRDDMTADYFIRSDFC